MYGEFVLAATGPSAYLDLDFAPPATPRIQAAPLLLMPSAFAWSAYVLCVCYCKPVR